MENTNQNKHHFELTDFDKRTQEKIVQQVREGEYQPELSILQ